MPSNADPALVEAPARAHRWKRMLDDGRYAPIGEIAAVDHFGLKYLGRISQLMLLAPRIVEALPDGSRPDSGSQG